MAHQQYNTTLKEMVGRVLGMKPNLPPTLAEGFINDCLRNLVDRRLNWTGLVKHSTIYIPDIITTGSIAMVQNSDNITVTGTTWPVSDVVNSTIPGVINRLGLQTVVPASMDGIDVDTLLYVDATGNPEIVAVLSVTSNSFTAKFTRFHNSGSTITCSSLSNRQIKLGVTYPIYTILAVTSTTTATIDLKWFATNLSLGYTITKMYYTIDPAVKTLISVIDQSQGIPPLAINKAVQWLNRIDPQRMATGYPQAFANRMPNDSGNMVYEVWPSPQSPRQLSAIWIQQPGYLSADDDLIPPFINPSVIFYYATAMAWGTRVGLTDQYFDPAISNKWMLQYEYQLNEAIKADDEKGGTGVQWDDGAWGIGGADWNRSHSIDALVGPF